MNQKCLVYILTLLCHCNSICSVPQYWLSANWIPSMEIQHESSNYDNFSNDHHFVQTTGLPWGELRNNSLTFGQQHCTKILCTVKILLSCYAIKIYCCLLASGNNSEIHSVAFVKGRQHNYLHQTSKTWFYKLPAARFSPKNWSFLIKTVWNFEKKTLKNIQKCPKNSKIFEKCGKILIVKKFEKKFQKTSGLSKI